MSVDINAPRKGKSYRHYKGGHYRVICVARLSELREVEVVVYASMEHGGIWVRPLARPGEASWSDIVQWPDGTIRHRFIRDDIDI